MAAYSFDYWGWYTGQADDGAPRSTPIAPENTSTSSTPGELRANFTGHEWVALPYAAPSPPPAPAPSVPDEVERWKAHYVLAAAGHMPAVRAAIAAIADDTQRAIAEALFEQRPTIRRLGELTLQIQQAAGISDAERDALFVAADALA